MRGWRLALNVMMEDPATGSEVHVRIGGQVAMVGHTLELPRQLKPSFLARRFKTTENLVEAKLEISKWVDGSQFPGSIQNILMMRVTSDSRSASIFTDVAKDARQ